MGNSSSVTKSEVETNVQEKPIIRKYGWKKDSTHEGDNYHCFTIYSNHTLIKKVDLRGHFPEVYDQGHLGSCTANALAGAYEFDEIIERESNIFRPSRLFIYYNERKMEGHINEDSGAEIRDGVMSLVNVGVCPETMLPYDISKFTDEPSEDCYEDALHHKVSEYKRVEQSLEQLKQCLIEGFPFVFGFIVYESFESAEVAKTGMMPMPEENEKILGGHAVVGVGFDDDKQVFIVRNSWGSSWGDKGYFYMPYNFIVNEKYASDFWALRRTVDN